MNIINELLKSTPQQTLKSYQSYLHTHLKLLLTSINKAKVQDITHIKIRKNKCIQQCYNKNLQPILLQKKNQGYNEHADAIYDTLDEIRECKQRCGEQKKAIKKYLDDINYYSSLKMARCSSGCVGDEYSKQFNQCMWSCYNKLDRRYKVYWVEERVKIQNRYYPTSNPANTA